MPEDVIPAPPQVPKGQIEARVSRNQYRLEITVGLRPLDQRVSKKDNSVSTAELKIVSRLQQAAFPSREKPQDHQSEKNPFRQNSHPRFMITGQVKQ